MRWIPRALGAVITGAVLCTVGPAVADDVGAPSNAELWRILQDQQQVIDAQKQQIEELNERLEATSDAIEQAEARTVPTGEAADEPSSTSTSRKWYERTTIGSYGELHFNTLENKASGDRVNEIDFHRFVLFLGHEFNDSIRFFSELELEHAVTGDGWEGEVELEQAYIEFDFLQNYRSKGGLFLVPVGILNETHEPTTFYGVERNPVEKNIIPTTWWEAGAGFDGHYSNGLAWDLAVTSGLKTDDFSIRGGRQKVSKADASDPAVTGRLAWRGIPGVELAVTAQYQNDIATDTLEQTRASLVEAHLDLQRGPLGLRALYARWDLFSDEAEAAGKDVQQGFYIEPSYRFADWGGIFMRYNRWDNDSGAYTIQQWDAGINWWPHPNVVLKLDYQNQKAPDDDEWDGVNLGIGYAF